MGLLDIPKVNADTPERKALIAILHDVQDLLAWAHQGEASDILNNIKSLALRGLREGAAH